MPSPRIATVIVNSEHAERLVAFWCGFLETEAGPSGEGITWLKKVRDTDVGIGVQQVERKLAAHTETHLDIVVDHLDEAQATVERLGGSVRKVNRLDDGFEWRVVADPDGNEFCIFEQH